MAKKVYVSEIQKVSVSDDKNSFKHVVSLSNFKHYFPNEPRPSCWHYSKLEEQHCRKCNNKPLQITSDEHVDGASTEGFWIDAEAQDLWWNTKTGIMKERSQQKKNSIAELKKLVSFEDVAKHYTIEYKKVSHYFSFSCPSKEHEDKNPSAVYYPDKDIFKCFGCGVYGDILSIIELLEET